MATATATRKTAAPSSAKKVTKPASKTATNPVGRKAAPKAAKAVSTSVAEDKNTKKKDKPEKVKVVRDSFTIPKTEYAQIAALKKRALGMGLATKKSELIRAGLLLLSQASDPALTKALGNVPTLKTGRPGKA